MLAAVKTRSANRLERHQGVRRHLLVRRRSRQHHEPTDRPHPRLLDQPVRQGRQAAPRSGPRRRVDLVLVARRLGHVHDREPTTRTASGTLIQKMPRQPTVSTSQPPTSGPIAVVTPGRPDHTPIALPRSSAANDAEMIARLPGVSSAARRPAARGRRPAPRSSARAAHSTDATANHDDARDEDRGAQPVAQRAADEDQRGERERVGVDDPLRPGDTGVEVAVDRRQGEPDDRAVEERHARAEDHRGEQPAALRRREPDRASALRRRRRTARPRCATGRRASSRRRGRAVAAPRPGGRTRTGCWGSRCRTGSRSCSSASRAGIPSGTGCSQKSTKAIVVSSRTCGVTVGEVEELRRTPACRGGR